MNTFFNRFNQDLITESQTLQTLLSVGYPANTSVIGSSPNKADELPMLRDFKESVQALERFFPINAEIDSVSNLPLWSISSNPIGDSIRERIVTLFVSVQYPNERKESMEVMMQW